MTRFFSLHPIEFLPALLLVGFASVLHAQTKYFVTDIGTLGGTQGFGYALNAWGQTAGASLASGDNGFLAFRTAPNRPIHPATDNLGTLGGVQSYGQAINLFGQVAGAAAITDSTPLHAFRTAPNRPINPATDDLGTLGGTESEGWAINVLGQVAGYASTTADDTILHAFRTAPNRAINPATDDLGTLGGTQSEAFGINDLGQVVGYASTSDDLLHAFRTAPNRAINPATDDLGTLGGTESYAFGINVSGQVVGYAATNDDIYVILHAFRTAPNRPIHPATDDLGTLGGADSYGWAINDWGQVVGSSYTDSDDTIEHAFLFSGVRMYDLNSSIPAGAAWDLEVAYGINDAGQIVGVGTHSGQVRPFLLTPASKGLCMNNGWENFGFKNQGQCVHFLEM